MKIVLSMLEPQKRLGKSPICDVSQTSESVTKIKHRGLRIGTWNFQGVCNDRKALKIGEVYLRTILIL